MTTKLNKGDIIIFKAEEDWLSKSIAWLTDSDVSHAAMVYSENSIAEIGARGAGIHNVNVSNGRGAYVMRLQPDMDTAPLIRTADKYVQAKLRYDFPALFLLAGLLVRNKMVPTAKLISITNRILSFVCLELDKYIHKAVLHQKERGMVCSQLVYQIFYDCGGSYRIQIKPPKKFSLLAANNSSAVCLQNLAENFSNEPLQENLHPEYNNPVNDTEMKELYTSLCESKDVVRTIGKDLSNTIPNLQDSAYYAKTFLDKTKKLMSLLGSDLPLDAMFITPADLAYHTVNLKKQGVIGITRVPASE